MVSKPKGSSLFDKSYSFIMKALIRSHYYQIKTHYREAGGAAITETRLNFLQAKPSVEKLLQKQGDW